MGQSKLNGTWQKIHNRFKVLLFVFSYVTLDHKTSLKSLGYICSNSQKYMSCTHAIVLQITFLYNHYISLTISSLNLHYILLSGCHQPPYRLPLDETYLPSSPSHLSSVVSSSLPSSTHFSSLDVNTATDTLCSTLTIWPLSSRPARTASSNPWLSDVHREYRTRFRAAERKWCKSNDLSDLSTYQSLLFSFSAEVHTSKSSHFHKINRHA